MLATNRGVKWTTLLGCRHHIAPAVPIADAPGTDLVAAKTEAVTPAHATQRAIRPAIRRWLLVIGDTLKDGLSALDPF